MPASGMPLSASCPRLACARSSIQRSFRLPGNKKAAAFLWEQNAAAAGARPAFNRIAYSAAHVVADPLAAIDPWLQCAVDWDATIAYRQRLWRLGLGVAEVNARRAVDHASRAVAPST